MKKLINRPEDAVRDELAGIASGPRRQAEGVHGSRLHRRADAPIRGKVAIVSGGGSGHEPLHGGFVGRGMLDAACPGRCSPRPPRSGGCCHEAVDGGAGCCISSRTTRATS